MVRPLSSDLVAVGSCLVPAFLRAPRSGRLRLLQVVVLERQRRSIGFVRSRDEKVPVAWSWEEDVGRFSWTLDVLMDLMVGWMVWWI